METETERERFPALAHAPVQEVVCGLHFDRLPGLDPISHGVFYQTIRDEFPIRQLHLPLSIGQPLQLFGPGRTRAWFVSQDDCFVLQLQDDLFYLNWRRRDDAYPRFHDQDGQPGVLTRMLEQFQRFSNFCQSEFGAVPSVRGLELSKVNWLVYGEHWHDWESLAQLLPMVGGLEIATDREEPDFNLRIARRVNEGSILTVAQTRTVPTTDGIAKRAVQLEFRARCARDDGVELAKQFESVNRQVNQSFETVIPKALDRFA